MAEPDLTGRKIFPRNLTARAATVVRGNPANARPESGVDNTHPGLEFDQRNLDKYFFPGLVFEFQYLQGAKLAEVQPDLFAYPYDLRPADGGGEVYLWYIFGTFGAQPQQPRLADVFDLDGYEVLRTVRDLEPGPLVVIVGRPPSLSDLGQVKTWMAQGIDFAGIIIDAEQDGSAGPTKYPTLRADDGTLLAAVLAGKRAEYLDANGVITPSLVQPGGLTRSLCAPWQWDFADCGCHYWAASKPDIVIGPNGGAQDLNFQRDRTVSAAPAGDPRGYDAWTDGQMKQPQMVQWWESLPFVIGEQETWVARPPVHSNVAKPWSRAAIIEELTYLAGVEHALCVQYLYAHYSLAAPAEQGSLTGKDLDVFLAAHEVFTIAVDEMRHFRLVNEALLLLGAPVSLGRSQTMGHQPNQMMGDFELAPLTPERLDFFIAVEAPSRNINRSDDLDGLYTHMLDSLQQRKAEYDDPSLVQRLSEVIKLIIDEGHGHYERFQRAKARLAPYDPAGYLQVTGGPQRAADPEHAAMQDLADGYYHTLLSGLRLAFSMPIGFRAALLKQARRSMYNLHEVAHLLAEKGIGVMFTMPEEGPEEGPVDAAAPVGAAPLPSAAAVLRSQVAQLFGDNSLLLEGLAASSDDAIKGLAKRHMQVADHMTAGMDLPPGLGGH